MEETLKEMIEIAKQNNNFELVQKLTEALNLVRGNQIVSEDVKLKSQENINQEENTIIEEKKEVIAEQKQDKEDKEEEIKKEEKPIKKQIQGQVSTITVYTDGKINIESKYLDIPIVTKDTHLRSAIRKIALNLAIDDATKESKSLEETIDAITKFDDVESLEKIDDFLVDASKVGQKGEEILEKYDAYKLDQSSFPYEDEYQDLLKDIAFAENEHKEGKGRGVNPNQYEDTIESYIRLINKIEKFIDSAHNKLSRGKISKLELKVMELNEEIRSLKETIAMIKETDRISDSISMM